MSGSPADTTADAAVDVAADLPPSVRSAQALVVALARLGVRDVVLAPGSRSAPLAYALVAASRAGGHRARGERSGHSAQSQRNGHGAHAGPLVRLHVRIDERDAAFLALGIARAGQVVAGPAAPPVAVVTTSGTAVANLHPAVLEAHHAGVPLLLLTADRPHEVRGTGANQTADQPGIFGSAVRLAVDVPAPDGRAGELTDLRALLTRAYAAATGRRTLDPGPVQLNLAYREPLAPGAGTLAALAAGVLDDGGALPGLGDVAQRAAAPEPDADGVADEPATVVVAGDGAGPDARRLAEARGWPLLAEASSGAAGSPALVAAHRLVLGARSLAGAVRQVVVVGRPTLSRPVQQLLADPGVRVVVVAPGSARWPDAARNAALVLGGIPPRWLEPAAPGGSGPVPRATPGRWLAAWRSASDAAAAVVDGLTEGTAPLDALGTAAAVAAASGPDDVLVVGSSNPVRDLDLVARWTDPPAVVANRGLAGIDGTVSTATGIALGLQRDRPGTVVRSLMGDLTFLHDVGGLLRGPHEPAVQLQVVVVNDDGGSIFATLEHGRLGDDELFERVFATPHGADLGALCAGYGVGHEVVRDAGRLRAALAAPPSGVSVLEVRVPRTTRGDDARALADAVVRAVERATDEGAAAG